MMQKKPLRFALLTAASVLAFTCAVQAQEGLSISWGGAIVAGDPALAARVPRAAPRTSAADIRVVADGLGVRPALDVAQLAIADLKMATEGTISAYF